MRLGVACNKCTIQGAERWQTAAILSLLLQPKRSYSNDIATRAYPNAEPRSESSRECELAQALTSGFRQPPCILAVRSLDMPLAVGRIGAAC